MDYSNLPMDQTGNSFINNTNTIAPAPQNITYEFYFPLPKNTRIYHVTYTELNLTEVAQLLNNRIDLSHVPDHRFPYHHNVQHSIRQEIVQQSAGYQQNYIPQQSFDIQPNFQEYSDNNAYDVSSIPLIQQPVDYQQDVIPQQSFDTMDIQPTFQEYLNNNANDASSVPPNSSEDGYNGVQLHQNN
ncbi:hypothetical protein RhiirC2_855928 [Rhizophagus irregularis]|uniref:Uncharacterized protein n=1 Tax=Rhizophagus irregularis TaxID=588596 RepID=A0A2N1MK81_9GLOM|nr:hypothetical protein RhiirC2_855928 [Rhizophagus irregularis]